MRKHTLPRAACWGAPARRACVTGCPKGYRKTGLWLGVMLAVTLLLSACGQKAAAGESETWLSATAEKTEALSAVATAERTEALSASASAEKTEALSASATAERTEALPTSGAEETMPLTSTAAEETVTLAAAASLETCLTEQLIPLFEQKHPGIFLVGTYDSSGKLQSQIEAGAGVDVFFSASSKQMNTLKEKGLMEESSIVDLLENKIVLIVPKGDEGTYAAFEDIVKADGVAFGDPDSVPAGQYAKEALTYLGLWEEVSAGASLGTNVTEVLNWVAEGSAGAGIVYATDAAQTDRVSVVAEAPEGSVKKVIYPAGVVKGCGHPDGARLFLEFLQSDEAMKIFKENGFTPAR